MILFPSTAICSAPFVCHEAKYNETVPLLCHQVVLEARLQLFQRSLYSVTGMPE
jgi:hypothetical protein